VEKSYPVVNIFTEDLTGEGAGWWEIEGWGHGDGGGLPKLTANLTEPAAYMKERASKGVNGRLKEE